MRLVMLGGPGSGKGTQGDRLSAHFGVPKISTGDALRAAVAAGTELGQRARPVMDAGGLVADVVAIGILRHRLADADCAKGFVLDGFPRNASQALVLDEGLSAAGKSALNHALYLRVSDDEILTRLLARASVEGRSDDHEDVIRNRIRRFNADVQPLLDHYRRQGKLRPVDGAGEPETDCRPLRCHVRKRSYSDNCRLSAAGPGTSRH
ncbi:MAG: adenylate kinase [Panacagrimonas sp.]